VNVAIISGFTNSDSVVAGQLFNNLVIQYNICALINRRRIMFPSTTNIFQSVEASLNTERVLGQTNLLTKKPRFTFRIVVHLRIVA
jgi:hypothetical protein